MGAWATVRKPWLAWSVCRALAISSRSSERNRHRFSKEFRRPRGLVWVAITWQTGLGPVVATRAAHSFCNRWVSHFRLLPVYFRLSWTPVYPVCLRTPPLFYRRTCWVMSPWMSLKKVVFTCFTMVSSRSYPAFRGKIRQRGVIRGPNGTIHRKISDRYTCDGRPRARGRQCDSQTHV